MLRVTFSIVRKSIKNGSPFQAVGRAARWQPCVVSKNCDRHYTIRFPTQSTQGTTVGETTFPSSSTTAAEHLDDDFLDSEEMHDTNEQPRHYHTMSATRTMSSASSSSVKRVQYDEDYDEYTLHMTPTQTTSCNESFENLEMIHHDDVFDVRETRREWDSSRGEGNEEDSDMIRYENEVPYEDFEELEEDWTLMHAEHNSGDSGEAEDHW